MRQVVSSPSLLTIVLAIATALLVAPLFSASPPPGSPVSGAVSEAVATTSVGHAPRIPSAISPAATTDPISVAGYGPATVALTWQQSGDWCFTDYRIQESTAGSGGPWTTVDTVTSSGITEMYWDGFSPGQTVWFQDIDDSGCGGGSATSNVVSVTFPNYASVSYSDTGPSSVQLSWNNNAHYGGLLSFDSYQAEEQINSGGFSTLGTISSASTQIYTVTGVTGLNTGTSYQFKIATTDQCNSCSGGSYPYTTDSNTITHLAIDAPSASPASVQTGKALALSVSVIGGSAPYTYVWTGLPAGCSSSSTAQPSCTPTSAGTFTVTVTVTDDRGSTLTSLPVSITVTSSGGDGGLLGGNGPGSTGSSDGWLLVALVVVVAVVLAVVLLARRRRSMRSEAPTGSGPSANEPAASPTSSPLTGQAGILLPSCDQCSSSLRPGARFCASCGGAVGSHDAGSAGTTQTLGRPES